jgi:hypothetical protein
MLGHLRSGEATVAQQLSDASSKFAILEGQFKVLAMRNRDGMSLARDERARNLGVLGTSGANAPVYKKWCATVAQICSERYKGAKSLLDRAKKCGSSVVTSDVFTGVMEQDQLVEFNHELYGLLSQQTGGSIWTAVDNVQEHVLNGLEAWRVITYGCSPKSPIKAEEIRRAITNGEQGRAASMQELKNKLVHFDALIRSFEEASEKSLEDGIRIIGLKAIIPLELEQKLIYELSFSDDYKKSREWIDSLVIKYTSTAPTVASQQFNMEIGNIGSAGPDNQVLSVLEKIVNKLDNMSGAQPSIGAVGSPNQSSNFNAKGNSKGSRPQQSNPKGGGKGTQCFKCKQYGHLARDCPQNVPVWRRGAAAGGGNGKGGGTGIPGGNGGNPNSKLLCRSYAKDGTCRFSPTCRYKHVYGPVGCLSGLASHAESLGKALPAAYIPDEHLTWDDSRDGYCLGKDVEIEACCRLALEADVMGPDDIADMKTFFLEQEGFPGQPMTMK